MILRFKWCKTQKEQDSISKDLERDLRKYQDNDIDFVTIVVYIPHLDLFHFSWNLEWKWILSSLKKKADGPSWYIKSRLKVWWWLSTPAPQSTLSGFWAPSGNNLMRREWERFINLEREVCTSVTGTWSQWYEQYFPRLLSVLVTQLSGQIPLLYRFVFSINHFM